MSDHKEYNLKEVSIVACGIPIEGGYSEDEVVRIEMPEAFGLKVGSDGSTTRYATNNGTAKITLRLMSTSQYNAILSTLHQLDKRVPGGSGVGPFAVKDNLGLSLHAASKCWIEKPPDVAYGAEPVVVEWILRAADMESFLGGN